MKKPRIKMFDDSHTIWSEVLEVCRNEIRQVGVYHSSYRGTAYCSACNWEGTYDDFVKSNFTCPCCGAVEANARGYGSNDCIEKGALIIDEKDGIIVFRFIGFRFYVNDEGEHFSAHEAYRIYTNQVEYEIYRLSDGKTLKKHASSRMDYNRFFNKPDIYEHHTYDAFVNNNEFIKNLDVLHERVSLESVFREIALNAAKNSVEKTCPIFCKALPTSEELLETQYQHLSRIDHHLEVTTAGNAYVYNLWCGKCGKFHTTTASKSSTGVTHASCDCGLPAIRLDANSKKVYSGGERNLFIEVQECKNCVMLRFVTFSVTSSVKALAFVNGLDTNVKLDATVENVHHVCCYNDGSVAIFDTQGTPLTAIDIESLRFATDLANPEILDELMAYDNVRDTGFIEFVNATANCSIEYFFGCTCTENVQELVKANLHSLVYEIARPRISNVPAYLLKKGKFTASMFPQNQIDDFALSDVNLASFINFMQIFKKDPTILYSDFCTLSRIVSKSMISDLYRRVPDARFDKIRAYLSRLHCDEALDPLESIPLWCDYLSTAKHLNLNLDDEDVCYPSNLKIAIDFLHKKRRNNSITASEVLQFEETAKKVNIHYEDDRWIVKTVKTIAEHSHYKDELMTSQMSYSQSNPNRFSVVVIDAAKDMVKYLVDINGEFENDTLVGGQVSQIFEFGTTICGVYRCQRIIQINKALSTTLGNIVTI